MGNKKGWVLPGLVMWIIYIAIFIIIGIAIKLQVSTTFGSFGFGH
jgi:hypothetical protein